MRNIMAEKFNGINIAAWPKETLAAFAEVCFKGFGTMNKNDYEVAMFHFLLHNDLQGRSDFDISLLLRIPESKVKRLRYEAALRYPADDDDLYKRAFITLLTSGAFRVTENHRIQFAISDKLFRLYINDLLMRDGRFADTSFNPNIVSLPWKDLEYPLDAFGVNDKQRVERIKQSAKESNIDLPKTMAECLREVGAGLVKETAKKIAGDSLASLLDLVYGKVETIITNNK